GEAAADAENNVGGVEEMAYRLRDSEPARAEREWMVLRERALAAEAAGDGRPQQFSERAQFAPRARPVHALAGIDHRPLGFRQQLRGFAHRVRVGAVTGRPDWLIGERLRHLLVPHV